MAHLIDKDALVAEIERLDALYHTSKDLSGDLFIQGLFCFLDTSEGKEVDLEKEIDNYIYTNNGRQRLALELDWKQCNITFNGGKLIDFAKYFFELGLKVAQKGED